MNIVLIGYRGTGKSSIGRKLAHKLDLSFYDTDDLIEAATGRSIGDIVREEGWACFRRIEKEVIGGMVGRGKGVVASGGGSVMDEENAEILKKNGIVIWLFADVETIMQRIYADSRNRGKRPPLSDDDLYRETTDLLEKRLPVYKRLADFSINTAEKSMDQIVDEICLFLETEGTL
jgi:shikimate kinase